ncbi:MAG: hypothetical protein ACYCZO_15700 [Daejeonella sp.]
MKNNLTVGINKSFFGQVSLIHMLAFYCFILPPAVSSTASKGQIPKKLNPIPILLKTLGDILAECLAVNLSKD